jgi:CRISPR-associated protein Csx16
MSTFVNISNHPSAGWGDEQRTAALALCDELLDLPFPQVDPRTGSRGVLELARSVLEQIPGGTTHAMVQGEFTLSFTLVRRLQRAGVICVAATTLRETVPVDEGRMIARFRFVRFRRYPGVDELVVPSPTDP